MQIFFNRHNRLSVSWVSHLQIQPTADGKQYFQPSTGTPGTRRANCMHCSKPLRDLSVRGFWHLQGITEPTPTDDEGRQWSFWPVTCRFLTVQGVSTPNTHIIQGSTVFGFMSMSFSKNKFPVSLLPFIYDKAGLKLVLL